MIGSSDLQSAKHDFPRISIDDGRITNFNPDPENAFSSIICNLDSDSNVIDSSDLQHEKHDLSKISIFDGILIDFNPFNENADSAIRCRTEPISKTMNLPIFDEPIDTRLPEQKWTTSTVAGIQMYSSFSRLGSRVVLVIHNPDFTRVRR
jgi:hypothetical protein